MHKGWMEGIGGDSTRQAAGGLLSLLEVHRPELLRFLMARCGDADEAQDLLQDLWLKLSETRIGPVANGRSYLFRMANNLVLDRRRTQQRAMSRDRNWIGEQHGYAVAAEERVDDAQPADDRIAAIQELSALKQAIAALPPGARRALELYRLEERGQSEIAAIMGISRSGVEKHLALAMKRLREALSDCGFYHMAASSEQRQDRGGETRMEPAP